MSGEHDDEIGNEDEFPDLAVVKNSNEHTGVMKTPTRIQKTIEY